MRIANILRSLFIRRIKPSQLVSRYPPHANIMKGSQISEDSVVGDYTYIGYSCYVTKSEIGRYCSIANNVSIGSGEHNLNKISTSAMFYENTYEALTEKDCVIGNDVWIGVDCIIRRGVHIGHGAVIGANSFVNQDVPDFAIFVGNPARLIRYRFSSELIKRIKDSSWWDMDYEEASNVIANLSKGIEF